MDLNDRNDAFNYPSNNVDQFIRRSNPLPQNLAVVTIVAKAVTTRKLENNELIQIGKYGFALAGDVKRSYYQLLLYGSKISVLINLILTKDFKYNVKENNTVCFLTNEKWFIEFASNDDAIDFNSHLAFVLWKLNGSKELFWMDLYYLPRNDNVSKFGSVVEIIYVANTIQGKTLGPEVSNNMKEDKFLKVNVREEGWEKSLLGVNNNTRRIVYIPITEMGAWKILTNGRQCLCLSVTVQNVYEVENNSNSYLPIKEEKPLIESIKNDSILIQSKETIDNNLLTEMIAATQIPSIELLYEEFQKLKIDNIKTNKRLTKLEALTEENKTEKIGNTSDLEFKKSLKTLYKNIIREFPVEKTFSGREIQTIIKDNFYNLLICSNQLQE